MDQQAFLIRVEPGKASETDIQALVDAVRDLNAVAGLGFIRIVIHRPKGLWVWFRSFWWYHRGA